MNNTILELLKLIADKFLFQGIIATIPTLVFKAFVPNFLKLSDLLSPTVYTILIWCICFLIVKIIESIFLSLREKSRNNKLEQYYNKKRIADAEENLKMLWRKIDQYYPDEKLLLLKFVKSNNQPISTINLGVCRNLVNDDYIVKTYTKMRSHTPHFKDPEKIHLVGGNTPIPCGEIFKLKDGIYEMLKYSYNKYGKICNFPIDENSEIYTDEKIW